MSADDDQIADALAFPGAQPDPTSAVPVQEVLKRAFSGKTLEQYVFHPAPVSAIMGPNGSGKTTASFIKALICSMAVPPSPVDGVRYARGAVVRDTYRNLETNTIPSWWETFPKELGKWKGGGGGEPGAHTMDLRLEDGTLLHLEVIFVAIGDHNVKQFCDGLQITWCFVNGMDVMPKELLQYMRPRLGRWPPPQHRPADWKGFVKYWRKLFADMNAPDLDNWTVEAFMEKPKPSYKFFRQPGGLDPDAENLTNLPEDYYSILLDNEVWWVNRFVHNKLGFGRDGTPVYGDYDDVLHVSKQPIKFDRSRTLYFGVDGGRDACAILGQKSYNGRMRVLREFIPERRMGAKQFGKWFLDRLAEEFPDVTKLMGFGDPAMFNPNDIDDDNVWAEIFANTADLAIGRNFKEAPSNEFTARKGAVDDLLREQEEGTPMLVLDPSCLTLRRGFMNGYRYAATKTHGDDVESPDPVKNKFSHPHDALQYLCLGASDYRIVRGLKARSGPPKEEIEWDPHQY